MQHHAGVGPVGRVAMRRPTVRIQVQLHVADDHGTAGKAEPRALEIRAAQQVPPAFVEFVGEVSPGNQSDAA